MSDLSRADRAAAARQALAEAAERLKTAERIAGGRRCGIRESEWIDGWWLGYSPRNGDGADVEGSWEDWVALAHAILKRDATKRGESA